MPLNNYLIPYFNITPQQFSYLVAAYTFSAGISGFFAAFFVDRFDRKRILLFGYIGFLIGSICCGIANSYLFISNIFISINKISFNKISDIKLYFKF